MKPDARFLRQAKDFWAHVRSISQHLGYTERRSGGRILVPSILAMAKALRELNLSSEHLIANGSKATPFGQLLFDYFAHRANVLFDYVQPRLMNAEQAAALYTEWTGRLPAREITMNKQKGEKAKPAYLTELVNMIIVAHGKGLSYVSNPLELTTVTRGGKPLRTLARRVDGCFPSTINPIALWEIKEYYWTTTFGSRVADGVYESLLDGMELEELREHEGIHVLHYLIIDAHYTWWECGRSYLCRIIDMLHMGYVDEVLFGREVVERLPALVDEWANIAKTREKR